MGVPLLSLPIVASMGLVLVMAFLLLFVTVGTAYLIFTMLYAPKIDAEDAYEADTQIASTYLAWFGSSLVDALAVILLAGINIAYNLYSFLLGMGVLFVAVSISLPLATVWTSYHDVAFELAFNGWSCLVNWLTIDFQVHRILNFIRLVFNFLHPLQRIINRLARLLLRTNLFIILQCVGIGFFNLLIYITNGGVHLVTAFITWLTSPGSIVTNQLDAKNAFTEVLRVNTVAIKILDCSCQELDFLWLIGLEWVGSDPTSTILTNVLKGAAELFVQTPFRTFTGLNQPTTYDLSPPYLTGPYGFMPNFNPLLTIAVNTTDPASKLLNYEIFVIFRELVGVFNPNIFTPGSDAEIVLLSDWFGTIGEVAAAVIEYFRVAYHLITALLAFIVQIIAFSFSLLFTPDDPLYITFFGPNMLCDLREWRALFSLGGGSSLYYKDGGVFGHLDKAALRLGLVADVISPYLAPLFIPVGRIVVSFVGMIYNMVPRTIFHLIDSEWRMFSPPVPPTGIPLSFWIAAPGLPPPPIQCPSQVHPGYFIPFLQAYYMDETSFFTFLIEQLDTIGEGWGDVFGLIHPTLGLVIKSLIKIPISFADAVMQTSFFMNVILFETVEKKAVFFSMWKANTFFQNVATVGTSLAGLIFLADTQYQCIPQTGQPDPSANWFCNVGNATQHFYLLLEDIGLQLVGIVVTTFVPPFIIPNFIGAIEDLTAQIRSLLAVILIIVPPFRIGTTTLTAAVIGLSSSFAPAITLPLWIGNFLLLSIQNVIGNDISQPVGASAAATLVGTISSFFKQFITGIFAKVLEVIGHGILLQVATFIDIFVSNPADPTTGVFYQLFKAVLGIIEVVVGLVTGYALKIFTSLFSFIGALIDLIFNTGGGSNNIGVRILNFVSALGTLVLDLIFSAPFLLIQLIFGILSAIFPEPLRTIITTIGELLSQGLCYTIQTFIDVVFYFINAFGAGLTKPDLCCSGDASCSANKKRAASDASEGSEKESTAGGWFKKRNIFRVFEGPKQETTVDVWAKKLRTDISEWATKTRTTRAHFQEREDRLRAVANKYFGHHQKKRQATDDTTLMNLTVVDATLYSELLGPNTTDIHVSDVPEEAMTMDQAIMVVAEAVPWTGGSTCDLLLQHILSNGKVNIETMPFMESLTLRDCVTKRTVGELLSVMPYLTWFPVDAFYNPMSWVYLGMRGFKAYGIYMQYTNDRKLPREVVLSSNYSASWAAKGMNVSHLTPDQYHIFTNWTLQVYFINNGGDITLADAVLSYFNAVRSGLTSQADYFGMLSSALKENNESEIVQWLAGEEYFRNHLLNPDLAAAQELWRAMLSIAVSTVNVTAQIAIVIKDSNVTSLALESAAAIPGLVKSTYAFFTEAENPEWDAAVKKRNVLVYGQEETPLVTASAVGLVSISLERATSSLVNWFWGRIDALRQNLRANSPRALRNRNIITHLWRSTMRGEDDVNTPPPGLRPDQVPIWKDRVARATAGNKILAARNSWRIKERVNTYATGGLTVQGQSVTPTVEVCNTSLVKFCLNCFILDAFFGEAASSVNQMIATYEPGGDWTYSKARFDYFETYLAANSTINVCGGNGTSAIEWPSDIEVWRGYTLFDIIGGNNLLVSLWDWTVAQIPELGVAISSSASRSISKPRAVAHYVSDAVVNKIRGWAYSSGTIAQISSFGRGEIGATNTTSNENRIYDYAMNHVGIDTTFLAYDLIPAVKPFLKVLDEVAHYFTDFSYSTTLLLDPVTNTSIKLPSFKGADGGLGVGFLGLLWDKIDADFEYSCAQRNMSILQGAVVLLLGYLLFSLAVSLTIGYLSSTAAMLIVTLGLAILPYVYFIIVYNYPAQNLFFLPWPLAPPCFADDLAQAAFCDVAPKCPGVFSPLVDGPYTEANCNTCPSTLKGRNFKTSIGLGDAIDWVILFLRIIYPPLLDFLSGILGSESGLVGFLLSPFGMQARFDKFANVNMADKRTFNVYLFGLVVMIPAVAPGLIWTGIVLGALVTSVLGVAWGILSKTAIVFYIMGLMTNAMWATMFASFVFSVTEADLAVFQAANRPNLERPVLDFDTDGRRKKRASLWSRGLFYYISRAASATGIEQMYAGAFGPAAAAQALDRRVKKDREREQSRARVYVDKFKQF